MRNLNGMGSLLRTITNYDIADFTELQQGPTEIGLRICAPSLPPRSNAYLVVLRNLKRRGQCLHMQQGCLGASLLHTWYHQLRCWLLLLGEQG